MYIINASLCLVLINRVAIVSKIWNMELYNFSLGGWHVMIVTVSVRVCLIYELWNHCPHIIADGMLDDRFRVFSCWFQA